MLYTVHPQKIVYRQNTICRQIHRPTYASQMPVGPVSANKPKFLYPPWKLVPGGLSAMSEWSRLIWAALGCVICWVWCDHLRWSCLSRCTTHRWHWSWERCHFQLLPQVHPSHPALGYSWWGTAISYVGPSCTLPCPWGVPHKLAHWDRATFPQHIPYFPHLSCIFGDLWRWLHGLRLCTHPPRLLLYLFCHNCACAFVLPWPERPQLSFDPTWHILLTFGPIWKCLVLWWYVEPNKVLHPLEGKVVSWTWGSRGWNL